MARCAGHLVGCADIDLAVFSVGFASGPVNRYVSGQLGRHFEITRRLAVKLGPTTTVHLDGVELANPD